MLESMQSDEKFTNNRKTSYVTDLITKQSNNLPRISDPSDCANNNVNHPYSIDRRNNKNNVANQPEIENPPAIAGIQRHGLSSKDQ